jgi:hypothetical protein
MVIVMFSDHKGMKLGFIKNWKIYKYEEIKQILKQLEVMEKNMKESIKYW